MSQPEEPILVDEFCFNNNKKARLNVSLYQKCMIIKPCKAKGETKTYFFDDINGCSIGKGKDPKDTNSYLTIYVYLKSKNLKRKRTTVELCYDKKDNYNGNLLEVTHWHNKIHLILTKSHVTVNTALNQMASANNDENKPFLVYINPNSGAGKAKTLFFERIWPVWAEANVPYTVVLTQYANHAREQIQTLDLTKYRGIIVVSGDGLVFEVINGLMDRQDCIEAIKTPIGQLPGGSGNALACCVSYWAKEAFSDLNLESMAMHSAFITCKHTIVPMDLVAIDIAGTNEVYRKLKHPHRIYSFLTIEWAIVADVDLESEKYRFMGGFRFVVGAVKRIMSLRVYRGRISFLPFDENYRPKNNSIRVMNANEFYQTNKPRTQQNVPIDDSAVKTKYLRPLNEPVPDDWKVIEENFVFFLVAYMPLIAKDFCAWADAKCNGGDMLLIFIKEGITKPQLLQLFTDTESGEYLKNPLVESIRVKAFRLEPLSDSGTIMVDGEHVPYGPIQGELLPSFSNCIAKIDASN